MKMFAGAYRLLYSQFVRYTVASGLALAVDIGILWAGTGLLGFQYLLSATLGFMAGVAVNYLLCVSWVFHERNLDNATAEFTVFISIGVCGLCINSASLWLLTDVMGVYYLASKLMVTTWVFLFNFLMRKYLLFTRRARAMSHPIARSLDIMTSAERG